MRRSQLVKWGSVMAIALMIGTIWFTITSLHSIHLAEDNLNKPQTQLKTGQETRDTAVVTPPPTPPPTPKPPQRTLDRMMYWKHPPGSAIRSGSMSWAPENRPGKYLLMCVDAGGFNNIRLQFETIVALGFLMGRTLVLPPNRRWYLLGSRQLNYADFFDMEDLKSLVPIITREEYDALPKDGTTHEILRLNTLKNTFAWPSVDAVRKSMDPTVLKRGIEMRTLVDAAPGVGGEGNYLHDTDFLEVTNEPYRMLATWHTFVFFAEPTHDVEFKRLMRDKVHYRQDIYELAAAGVDQMGGLGKYTSLHIRRGDFQCDARAVQYSNTFGSGNHLPLGILRQGLTHPKYSATWNLCSGAAGRSECTFRLMRKTWLSSNPFEKLGTR
eukprot:m.72153 g.72153  ORF g.72153 m.72153 type:complete len:383 (+) comp10097_c0_seq1:213-1361(+)